MEVNEVIPTGKFTQAQLDLLKMFSVEIPEDDWQAIREYAKHYLPGVQRKKWISFLKKKDGVKKKLKNGLKNICVHHINNESSY